MKSPSVKSTAGLASYSSKYALSERLVCGECGTLYRRCTWTQRGEKRIVWRCASRLDYGKKYCHHSKTMDEKPLQQAILAAIQTVVSSQNNSVGQIETTLKSEIIPFSGGMSLGEIDRRLAELETEFSEILKLATSDPTAHREQFKKILDEQTYLKQKRSVILAEDRKNSENELKIQTAKRLMSEPLNLTEWDESVIRQLVDTVKVISKDEISVTLTDGREVRQAVVR